MKRFYFLIHQCLLIGFTLVFFSILQTSHAHELIPRALQEYIEMHPDATSEEIENFAQTQSPEFAEKYENGAEIIAIIKNNETSFFDNIYDFFKLGVGHILSGPDHILFVLSLLLVFISWKEMFRLTWVFTLAHSITLILAGTGILVLSSRIVVPIIALSISYVAFTSVFLRSWGFFGDHRSKILAIFFFGLFHGLGFAGLLQEISIPDNKFISSLVAFNLGIEAGQLMIVCIAFPFIYFFKDKKNYPSLMKIFSSIIIIIGFYWFFQRIFSL